MPFSPDWSSERLSCLLPPVQGFHIDAGDFAAVHGFDVSEVGVDGMEGVFHFAGFRVFPADQFFERYPAFSSLVGGGMLDFG